MQLRKICVLGGSGFVGSSVVAKLDQAGYSVTVLTRRRDSGKHLFLLPNVNVVECDVMNDRELAAGVDGADAVVNLIGILHQGGGASFDAIHHQLPARLARICEASGIKRLVQMSSLQADAKAPSEYLRTKAAGEAALLAFAQKINITIFRPSVIFGRGDRFINLFAALIRFLPVVLLAKPNARFQPVWVEDVASCFVASIRDTRTYGQVYELAGPKVYSFRQLVQQVMSVLGVQRPLLGLCNMLSYAQAFMMELLPVKLMSRDNVRSMEVDSVSQQPFPEIFGVEPASMEVVIPEYLVDATQRGKYDRFRSFAAR
ncbi:complex I NDUFA9 subunit family protein [Methylotenera sp. G11]|uniref:complex I NDUFA9 subunit family protein n=1 Tax=Methylotenera sp. G11 TaxID=1506585 RepID=UPI000645564E|nr:complex I NDUFA9 subunit family protein [Methylotenera sp. G11]